MKKIFDGRGDDNVSRKQASAGLAGPGHNTDSGQQLSSFTELKLGKKSGQLFPNDSSPLKTT